VCIYIYKVNRDVAIDKLSRQMELGAIVAIAAKSLTKMGNLEPAAAKALGAMPAVKFCRNLGLMIRGVNLVLISGY
jgi:hypothetical protein